MNADISHIAENIMHFARLLRAAGLPAGPGKILEAQQALEIIGFGGREDFYWALHSFFTNSHDQHEIYDQAFRIFWRKHDDKIFLGAPLPSNFKGAEKSAQKPISRRLWDAFHSQNCQADQQQEKIELDTALSFSDQERLTAMDFETMSREEEIAAQKAIAALPFTDWALPSRRYQRSHLNRRIDMRASLKAMVRQPNGLAPPRYRERQSIRPPIVILLDISGSMNRYSRMALHYAHALGRAGIKLHLFLFGTRLSNVTPAIRLRDIDAAMTGIAQTAPDWSGGTRIGLTLGEFNQNWGRRVLGQNASVLFISDGLERETESNLGHEMAKLRRSCRRLVWLNPLLRWEGFEPKANSLRAILPHVDEFRPVHNLLSLMDLSHALTQPHYRRGRL